MYKLTQLLGIHSHSGSSPRVSPFFWEFLLYWSHYNIHPVVLMVRPELWTQTNTHLIPNTVYIDSSQRNPAKILTGSAVTQDADQKYESHQSLHSSEMAELLLGWKLVIFKVWSVIETCSVLPVFIQLLPPTAPHHCWVVFLESNWFSEEKKKSSFFPLQLSTSVFCTIEEMWRQ